METDVAGSVLEFTDYYPYGATRFDKTATSYTGNDYKFTGKELDIDSGLYYYGARYYNPALGRFMSQDPAARDLSDTIILLNPQALNTYSYVMNNPLKYIDPTGEFAQLAVLVPVFSIPVIGEIAMGVAAVGLVGIGIYAIVERTDIKNEPFITPASQEKGVGTTGNTSESNPALPNTFTTPGSSIQPLNLFITPAYQPEALSNICTAKGNAPKSTLPRDPKTRDYLPAPGVEAPHTTLGTRVGSDGVPYTQGATFDSNGNFLWRTDVTGHAERHDHQNPHWHPATSPNGVEEGFGYTTDLLPLDKLK